MRENGAIEGIIKQSISKEYRDGEKRIFMNTKLEHWPANEGGWEDHFVMKTQTGLYFRLKDADRMRAGDR